MGDIDKKITFSENLSKGGGKKFVPSAARAGAISKKGPKQVCVASWRHIDKIFPAIRGITS